MADRKRAKSSPAKSSSRARIQPPRPPIRSLNWYAETFNCNRRTIAIWQKQEGVAISDHDGMVSMIQRRKSKAPQTPAGAEKNPIWRIAEAKAKKLERENRIAERVEARTYMTIDDVEKIVRGGIQRLENIPGKAQSELGLTEKQANRLRELLDEARTEWARLLSGPAGPGDSPAAPS